MHLGVAVEGQGQTNSKSANLTFLTVSVLARERKTLPCKICRQSDEALQIERLIVSAVRGREIS
jgi:hypothetical protein